MMAEALEVAVAVAAWAEVVVPGWTLALSLRTGRGGGADTWAMAVEAFTPLAGIPSVGSRSVVGSAEEDLGTIFERLSPVSKSG